MKLSKSSKGWSEATCDLVLYTCRLLHKRKDLPRLEVYVKDIGLKEELCKYCNKNTYTIKCEEYKICTNCLKEE